MTCERRLSTPWVAGSNPAGIASASDHKSPITTGFLHFTLRRTYNQLLERKGIKAGLSRALLAKIPGLIPGLVPQGETDRALACRQKGQP
jgi:hypothetical protein